MESLQLLKHQHQVTAGAGGGDEEEAPLLPSGWRILPFRSSQSIMGRKKALTLIIGWPSDLRVSFVKQKDIAL